MLRMVSYPHRPQSGHIMCYLNRTYHVLPTSCSCRSCVPKVVFINSVTARFTASGIALEPGFPSMGCEPGTGLVLKALLGVSATSGLRLLGSRLLLFGFIFDPFELMFTLLS